MQPQKCLLDIVHVFQAFSFFCINSVWVFWAGTAFLISSSKQRIPGSKLCLNGTAWAQALSKAGAIMLLSLIQAQQPHISSCRGCWAPSPFFSLVREAYRQGRCGGSKWILVIFCSAHHCQPSAALGLPSSPKQKLLLQWKSSFCLRQEKQQLQEQFSQVTQEAVTPAESSPCPSTALGYWGAKFPPQLQGGPSHKVTGWETEGVGMQGTNRPTITAVPCCGFVQKHWIFEIGKLGRGIPKLAVREKPRQIPTISVNAASAPSPSPFPEGKPMPGARSLPSYKYPAIN